MNTIQKPRFLRPSPVFNDLLFSLSNGAIASLYASRCGWDNCSSVTMPLPGSQQMMQVNSREIQPRMSGKLPTFSPDVPLSLSDSVILREESFGCSLFESSRCLSRSFNQTATELLEIFRHGLPIDTANKSLGKKYVFESGAEERRVVLEFVSQLVIDGILREDNGKAKSCIKWFSHTGKSLSDSHLSSPFGLEIELTYRCSNTCRHCAFESGPGNTTQELSSEAWFDLLEEARRCGVPQIEFTGGDPFTRSDCITILRKADELGYRFNINSDAGKWTRELAAQIKELKGIDSMQCSIDGHDSLSHDYLRGDGSFEATCKGIRCMIDNDIPVDAGITIHKGNYRQLRQICELARSVGIRKVFVNIMYALGRARSLQDQICSPEDIELALHDFCSIVSAGISIPADEVWVDLANSLGSSNECVSEAAKKYIARYKMRPAYTFAGTTDLRVDPQGNYYVCGKYDRRKDVFCGNMLEHSMDLVWNKSPVLDTIRKNTDYSTPTPLIAISTLERLFSISDK